LPPYPALSSIPRIFALAWFYVAHTDSSFSIKRLTAMVKGYQDVTPIPNRRIMGPAFGGTLYPDRKCPAHRY